MGDTLVWTGPFTLPVGTDLALNYQVDTSTAAGWHWPCNEVTALAGGTLVGPARACVEVGPEKAFLYLPIILKNVRWAQFTIAKSVTPSTVTDLPGQVVEYTVTIANVGDRPGKLAAVVDTLPGGFTYLDMAAGSDVTADPTGTTGTIRWTGPFEVAGGGHAAADLQGGTQPDGGPVQQLGQRRDPGGETARRPGLGAGHRGAGRAVGGTFRKRHGSAGPGSGTTGGSRPLEQWYWGQNDGVNSSGAVNHACCGDPEHEAEDAVLMYDHDEAEQWTDYRVEAKLNLHQGTGAVGLWVRGKHEFRDDGSGQWITGYYVVVGGKAGGDYHTVKVAQLQTATDCWGAACDNPGNLYDFNNPHDLVDPPIQLPGTFTRGVWHTIAVEVRGANIKLWWDGELSLDYTDPKEPFLTGTVGFKTYKADWISYDDIIVTPLQ